MPRFKVRLEEVCSHEVEVDAPDRGAAEDAAEEAFVQGEARFVASEDRTVTSVTEIAAEPVSA